METIASHPGTVTAVKEGVVDVQIVSFGACSSCEAQHKCGFADQKDKTVTVKCSDWQNFKEGDHVVVNINKNLGLLSVLIAYVLPSVALILAIVIPLSMGMSEGISAIIGLTVMALYVLILYSQRNKLERKFTFTVAKED